MSLEQLKGLALAWGGGGWSLIKGPRFFISKVFDLQVGAKAPCRMNAVICLVDGEAGTGAGKGGVKAPCRMNAVWGLGEQGQEPGDNDWAHGLEGTGERNPTRTF